MTIRNISHTIKLHQESINYLNRIFENYTETQYNSGKVVENPIIHLYPVEDTYDENGELDGFVDALFTNIHVYDTESMEYYVLERRDGIRFYNDVKVEMVRAFKDGSTLIQLYGKFLIGSHQEVAVYKFKE